MDDMDEHTNTRTAYFLSMIRVCETKYPTLKSLVRAENFLIPMDLPLFNRHLVRFIHECREPDCVKYHMFREFRRCVKAEMRRIRTHEAARLAEDVAIMAVRNMMGHQDDEEDFDNQGPITIQERLNWYRTEITFVYHGEFIDTLRTHFEFLEVPELRLVVDVSEPIVNLYADMLDIGHHAFFDFRELIGALKVAKCMFHPHAPALLDFPGR